MSKKGSARRPKELKASELRFNCRLSDLKFKTTADVEPLAEFIGQERAVQSIKLGLAMKSFGYNIYVAGPPSTGKKTLVRSLVRSIAGGQPPPDDIFFVHNFDEPDRPRALRVPAGLACEFQEDMESLINTLKEEVPKAFKSEDYETRRNEIIKKFQQERAKLIEAVQEEAREKSLVVKAAGSQIMAVPVKEGKELTPEQFSELSPEDEEEIRRKQEAISERIQETYREIRDKQRTTQQQLKELDRTVALIATGNYLDEMRRQYKEFPAIQEYLDGVQADLLNHISDFLDVGEEEGGESSPQEIFAAQIRSSGDPLKRYEVNVIVDNCEQDGAPVISESHPTYRNLIGFLEREARMGTLYTDFTMIRSGSILQANGGYLIMDLVDLLITPLAWEALKRVLQDGEVEIQDPTEQLGMVATHGLRPEPVKVDLKVVILGSADHYSLLYAFDEDFQKLFKIKADFDTVIRRTEDHLYQYARFVKKVCDKEDLKHFTKKAVARLIENGSRVVSDKTRLTLRFSEVADLIRESSYWASQNGDEFVTEEDVEKAIREKIFRSNLYEERIQEMIDEESILIDTEGEAVGQINGLSVFQVGDYAFGKPTRLTAETGLGEKGIINIEREARLSGKLHDKGVLILSGYLHGKYGRKHPLSLYASICFEQSYGGVDGDSASSTELYAILSDLANVPIKQGIAVTGSINQKGMIQPIGGVNQKIEGFFQTCSARGLTGEQGVIIPLQNVQNLMLQSAVIQAVKDKKFHVYPVATVDEGLEILTGIKAGEPDEEGNYPEGTMHYLVEKKLDEMAEKMREHQQDGGDSGS